jgi:hypothetical protein
MTPLRAVVRARILRCPRNAAAVACYPSLGPALPQMLVRSGPTVGSNVFRQDGGPQLPDARPCRSRSLSLSSCRGNQRRVDLLLKARSARACERNGHARSSAREEVDDRAYVVRRRPGATYSARGHAADPHRTGSTAASCRHSGSCHGAAGGSGSGAGARRKG